MKKLGSAPKDLGGSFTVTPDGKSFLYTRVHRLEKDLMLVEDFK
jgi:hypothetical protein